MENLSKFDSINCDSFQESALFIDRVALAKQGDNALGSVNVFVRVLLFEPFDLHFWHGGRPWPRIGWDFRSRS